ncbi:serine/threonine-protein kinase [Bacteroides sp. 519]|uniref:serine/threonine protein kinase n=1 Tax=Bacteroides sp. 519 TaxID=2302937 RepID=UPI0013CFA3D5|nr:serine/threonine-protein kinase [Bacteroides sp. 519]NDV57647.1 serine/threonine protein kinase [Bacteroides sp. 519]
MDSSFILHKTPQSTSIHSQLIGEGSTSLCYKVNRHNKWFLMKQLKPELTTNTIYLEAFKKEFEVGIHLDHPNIVQYVDKTDTEIFMQYVDGLPLNEFTKIRPGYFKNKNNQNLFISELLSAIDYLHLHQTLHLDLKPSNILITCKGNHVKLIDFGFAYQDAFLYHPAGTEGYTAPEQITGSELLPASDIYAIGQVLKEIGIGRKKVINKCIADDPKRRYQSVEELKAALQPTTARKWYLVAACVVVVGLVGTLFLNRQDGAQLSEYDRYTTRLNEYFKPVDSLLKVSPEEHKKFAVIFKEVFDKCYQAAKEDELCGKYIETRNNEFADYTQETRFKYFRIIAEEKYNSFVDTSGK